MRYAHRQTTRSHDVVHSSRRPNRRRSSWQCFLKTMHEACIPGVEEAHVRNTVLHHDEAFEAAAKSEARDLLWVESGILDDIRVQHACAAHLEPPSFLSGQGEPCVDLNRG